MIALGFNLLYQQFLLKEQKMESSICWKMCSPGNLKASIRHIGKKYSFSWKRCWKKKRKQLNPFLKVSITFVLWKVSWFIKKRIFDTVENYCLDFFSQSLLENGFRSEAPNFQSVDWYKSVACWEPSHASGGWAHETSFAHVQNLVKRAKSSPPPPLLPSLPPVHGARKVGDLWFRWYLSG